MDGPADRLPKKTRKSTKTPCDLLCLFVFFVASKTQAARGLFSSHKETQEDTKSTKNVPEDSGQNVELDYLKLLDWTGRQFQADKRGVIPATCAPIPHRLDCSEETWFDLVRYEAESVLSVRADGNGCATHHRFTLPGRRTRSNQTVGDGWHDLRLIPAIFCVSSCFLWPAKLELREHKKVAGTEN